MNQNKKNSVVAGLYGNTLEWYDFSLYASFAAIFAGAFFPAEASFLALLAAFSVFAVGFLVRPIGGIFLGHYADHFGRRQALIVSVVIMTIATFAIAFLPTYRTAGAIAPILFILCRITQGIATGGELPGSATFLIEHMFHYGRGFAGSLVLCTAFLGIFLGSFTAFLLSASMSYNLFSTVGWRIAYAIGGTLGFVGIYLRFKSTEPETFAKIKPADELPAGIVFRHYRKELLLAIACTSILAIGNYILIAYVTTFLVKFEGFSFKDALVINFMALLLLTVLIPCMGMFSDHIGRKRVFCLGLWGVFIGVFPLFGLLLSGNWWYVLASELLLAVLLAPINATVPTILAEMFPTMVRASGTSIGYNVGQAIFGGTMPLVALILIQLTGNHYAPAWYVVVWSVVVIIAVRYLDDPFEAMSEEARGKKLKETSAFSN